MTTPFTLNEPAINAIIARLETTLNPIIDTINAGADVVADGYTIKYPATILAAPPVLGQMVNFPIVAVADGDIVLVDDVGWGSTERMDMYVVAYIQDPDPVALGWRLRRYAQAIVSCVMAGRNLDAGAWGTVFKRVIPARRIARTDPQGATQLLSWITFEFTAMLEQDTG